MATSFRQIIDKAVKDKRFLVTMPWVDGEALARGRALSRISAQARVSRSDAGAAAASAYSSIMLSFTPIQPPDMWNVG